MRRPLFTLAMTAVILFTAPIASPHAHEKPTERGLLVQVGRDHVDLMVTYAEPPGPAVDLLIKRHDVDGDGRIGPAEAQLAGQAWLGRALVGISLEVLGQRPGMQTPEVKFRHEPDGSLAMAALVRYTLDAAPTHRVRIRLDADARTPTTTTHLHAGDGYTITRVADRTFEARQHVGPLGLGPGADFEVVVREVPTP